MNEIGIDIETTSGYSLMDCGVYKYVESKDFKILLFAYAINGGQVKIIDLTRDKLPGNILSILLNPDWVKTAWNANFERVCINKYFGLNIPIAEWDCTMVRASLLGLPLSLDACSKVLKTSVKDKKGKALIKMFSEKQEDPDIEFENWEEFKDYCIKDVIAEQDIKQKISFHKVVNFERRVWILDQKLNDYGITVDRAFAIKAIEIEAEYSARLLEEAKLISGLENPNSPAQLKKWIFEQTGIFVKSLSKDSIVEIDAEYVDVNKVLTIRKELSKTSNKKYISMIKGICSDDRIRGLLQYNGGNRTGRWAGRLVQVHNLVRNNLKDLDTARKALLNDDIEMLYGNVNYILSQLIRTAFIPSKGCKFIISDFSAIEARVIAWLCNEKWRLDVFKTHGKIYEASASMMFKVPIEQVTKGSELRTKGKISELALGYQGSVGALERMGGADMGLDEDEMLSLVRTWRKANKKIVQFWYDIDSICRAVIEDRVPRKLNYLTISYSRNTLFIELPTKRKLCYLNAKLVPIVIKGVPKQAIVYQGIDQMTNQWVNISTYGGKLTENVVQAIARDCLAEKMLVLDLAGYDIAMHVHDEVVLDVPETNIDVDFDRVNIIMKSSISWAPGLPLGVESFFSDYYKKD